MPFFSSSSEVQVNGGNFYDIAGDINVRSARPVGSTQSANRLLSGPDRRDRHTGRSARLPYNVSRRPQIVGCSDELHGPIPTSAMTEIGLLPSSSEANRQSFSRLELESQQSSAQDHHTNWRNDPYLGPSTYRYPSVLRSISEETVSENPHPSQYPPGDLDPPHERIHSLTFPGDLGGPPNVLIGSATGARDSRQPEPKTSINGGTFISGNVNHIQRRGETGFHILYRAAANDASHDSGERYPPPRCHPETRMDMLDDLRTWSFGNDPESRVLWLHGPAGAGKSAIAQSFCQKLDLEGRLGGSFFFKRGHASRGNANKLFPTLAYQLAVLLPKFKSVVSERIEDDPSIFDKSHSMQLQKLIIEPTQDSDSGLTRTFVIIIDGLDECEGQDIQQEILRSIGNSFQRSHLPLRFLVASRPEPHITEVFREPSLNGFHHPLNIQQSLYDVQKYLQDEFARIHREHRETMAMISSPWPSQQAVDYLVLKSSGYFIYASTVIKFIDDKSFRPPERLEVIMGGVTDPDCESPFETLDQLYTQILSDVRARPRLLRILTVITAKLDLSVPDIEKLLDLKPGDVLLALRGLHSVLKLWTPSLGSEDHDEDLHLDVHHASFLDFLKDPIRSGIFHIGGSHRTHLARDILKIYNEPTVNRYGDLAWHLGPRGLAYLTSPPTSPEFLPLLHAINPDFVFYPSPHHSAVAAERIVDWLKKIRPVPYDLIQIWEDYLFMLLYADIRVNEMGPPNFDHCSLVFQTCLQFCRYSHTFEFFCHGLFDQSVQFCDIRLLLDWSWGDMRAAFSPVRAILGTDQKKIYGLWLSTPGRCPPPYRGICSSSILSKLARNCLYTIRKLFTGEIPWKQFCRSINGWSYLLRSCPPCPDLLGQFEPVSASSNIFRYCGVADLQNIVQWLKTFPQPPSELLACYEGYLATKMSATDSRGIEVSWRKWQQNLTRCDCFGLQSTLAVPASPSS
ncbi:hypothetical protein FB451DRAFT_1080788 [Mycena latifolia]|nr:hypothetical protein FB451DRAFT_1080788 [Mycena latifolia]